MSLWVERRINFLQPTNGSLCTGEPFQHFYVDEPVCPSHFFSVWCTFSLTYQSRSSKGVMLANIIFKMRNPIWERCIPAGHLLIKNNGEFYSNILQNEENILYIVYLIHVYLRVWSTCVILNKDICLKSFSVYDPIFSLSLLVVSGSEWMWQSLTIGVRLVSSWCPVEFLDITDCPLFLK